MRHCVFCGGDGLTREHLFGDWLINRFYPNIKSDNGHWKKSNLRLGADGSEVLPYKGFNEAGHSALIKHKMLCKGCNNSWSRDLQDQMIPIFREVFYERGGVIDPWAKTLLAKWLYFTHLKIQWLHPINSDGGATGSIVNFYGQLFEEGRAEARLAFRESGRLPSDVSVYASLVEGADLNSVGIFQYVNGAKLVDQSGEPADSGIYREWSATFISTGAMVGFVTNLKEDELGANEMILELMSQAKILRLDKGVILETRKIFQPCSARDVNLSWVQAINALLSRGGAQPNIRPMRSFVG